MGMWGLDGGLGGNCSRELYLCGRGVVLTSAATV
jgi:hypothetical protein